MPNTDKTILLPQLQRYDQKIKEWANNKFLTNTDTSSLPKATATTLGGVKVGNGLSVTDDGVLSAEDDIVFTWDFDTSAFSCNKTFAEVKKITTTGVRRTATVNGLLKNFSITLLVVGANDDGVMFFGTAPRDALGSGMLGSKTDGTITYLFQKGLVILYNSNGQIQMTEDLSNLNTNMSFDFKNTTFQYDRYNSFDLKDGGITSTKIADNAITEAKLAKYAVTTDKIVDGAITKNKLARGIVDSNLKAERIAISGGSKHSFGLWSIAAPHSPASASFIINVFYNSSILIISDVQCSPSSVVSMTIEHSKVKKSGINRSGYVAFDLDPPMYDSLKIAGQALNIFETSEASSNFCFVGLFFTVNI